MWSDDIMVNAKADGASFADKIVSITIPLESALATGKTYVDQKEYAKAAIDNNNTWTIRTGEKESDIIVLGEGPEIEGLYTIDRLMQDYKYTQPMAIADTTKDKDLPCFEIKGI